MSGLQEEPPHLPHDGGSDPAASPDGTALYAGLRAARAELSEAIREIQRVPGFEQFLAPARFADIAAAADHPLVYVTPSERAGLALLVRGADVVDVPLPELSAARVREWAECHRELFPAARDRSAQARAAWSRHLRDVTEWLWHAVAGPLMDELRGERQIALIPGGQTALLPLHAAGYPDAARPTGFTYLIDECVVGYTPNARALAAARRSAAGVIPARLLAVTNPATRSPRDRLPFSRWEGRAAAAAFPGGITLDGADATVERVRDVLPDAGIALFGCHGAADQSEPLQSGLVLAGGKPLRLADILPLRLNVRLAVLSACESFVPGLALPDEVVNLPTGLLQAGVAGVVASMWAIDDHATAVLMTEFYRRWRTGANDVGSPATALAGAQRWLRDATPAAIEEHWAAALEAKAPWLPEEVAAALLPEVFAAGESDSLPWAQPSVWAAFTFTGA